MMKHTGSFILILILSVIANAQTQKVKTFTIEGKIHDFYKVDTVYLVNNITRDTIAKTTSKNGRFQFKGSLKVEPEWFSVRLKGQNTWLTFLLENNLINVEGSANNWKNAKVIGSRVTNDYKELLALQRPLVDSIERLSKRRQQTFRNNDTLNEKRFSAHINLLSDRQDRLWNKFIDEHLNSLYTPFLLLHGGAPGYENKAKRYNQLSSLAQKSNYGIQLKEEMERQKIRSTIKIGNIAPNFFSITPNGDSLSLNKVISKSKLLLIDFWASWCIPCRKEIPNIRRVFETFQNDGFNILSVSFDSKESDWKQAIIKEKMLWFHMSELKDRNESAGKIYGINGLPSAILLDSNGRIIAIEAGAGSDLISEGGSLRGEALYKKIEELLGRKNE